MLSVAILFFLSIATNKRIIPHFCQVFRPGPLGVHCKINLDRRQLVVYIGECTNKHGHSTPAIMRRTPTTMQNERIAMSTADYNTPNAQNEDEVADLTRKGKIYWVATAVAQ